MARCPGRPLPSPARRAASGFARTSSVASSHCGARRARSPVAASTKPPTWPPGTPADPRSHAQTRAGWPASAPSLRPAPRALRRHGDLVTAAAAPAEANRRRRPGSRASRRGGPCGRTRSARRMRGPASVSLRFGAPGMWRSASRLSTPLRSPLNAAAGMPAHVQLAWSRGARSGRLSRSSRGLPYAQASRWGIKEVHALCT